MITLNQQAIRDYQVCSLYYKHKYILEDKISVHKREVLTEQFEATLRRVVAFFFYKRQGGAIPSYNALMNRWQKLWFPDDIAAYDIATDQHESIAHRNIASYSNMAAAALLQFHEDFSGDIGDPIIIDEKFLIPLWKDVRLEGTFDLVLKRKEAFHIVRWSTKTKRPMLEQFAYDIAAQKLAFNYRSEVKRNVSFSLYDLASTKPGMVHMKSSPEDINAFLFWANEATHSQKFVPRRGFTSYCRGCPFDKPCQEFSYPQIKD